MLQVYYIDNYKYVKLFQNIPILILSHITMLCPSRVLVAGASFFAIPTSYAL